MGRPKKYKTEEERKAAARNSKRVSRARYRVKEADLARSIVCAKCKETEATREEAIVTGHMHRGAWFCPECCDARREALGYVTGY